jgi:hypothetical protein
MRLIATVLALLATAAVATAPPALAAAPPLNLQPPTISGTPMVGQTLSEANGTWSNNPTDFAYQWQRCDPAGVTCVDVVGATGQTYLLTAMDVGAVIRVLETASGAGGVAAAAASLPTAVVAPQPPPSATGVPSISGVTVAGQVLTEAHAPWTGSPTSYTYQWLECDAAGQACVAIPGATMATYTLGSADVGHTLRVLEAAFNAGGSGGPATSAPTAVVASPAVPPKNTTSPSVTGRHQIGSTLTCSPGVWSGTQPITYAYQWLGDASPVSGATQSTYTLQPTDLAQAFACRVTARNAGGSASELSPAAVVTAASECGGLSGAVLMRCRAKATYTRSLARCSTISRKTRTGRQHRTACVAKAKLTYKRALAVARCQSIKSSSKRAACVARAHKIKR